METREILSIRKIEDRTVEFIISDGSIDAHGTILSPGGWDLRRFEKNGIFSYQHKAESDPNPDYILGPARAYQEGERLIGVATFEDEQTNPLAEKIFRKVKSGTLKAVSVGFIPKTQHREKDVIVYDSMELLEFSIVNIPSNPNAVKRSTGTNRYNNENNLLKSPSMKVSDELKQQRTALENELQELPNSGIEKRELETRKNELTDEIEKLSGEITAAEAKEKAVVERAAKYGRVISKSHDDDLDRYSFTRAIRVAMGIDRGGLEEEMNQEGRRELSNLGQVARGFVIPTMVLERASSGQNYSTLGDGGYLVGPGGMKFYEALRNKLTLTKLGATFHTGLTGTLPLVGGGTFTAAWVAEGAEITKSKTSFVDRGTLRPKRLGSLGAISKELIYSSLPNVEQIIVNELTDSIAQAIESAAINGSGTGATPTGILNYVGIGSVVGGDNGAAIAWDDVVGLETAVNSANGYGQRMGYLTNSKVIGKMKTTAKTDTEFIMNGNMLNGYNIQETNAVPSTLDKGTSTGVCSAVIFGAWEHLIIGQWGGLDLIVDPYTRKAFGEIELNTTQFMDLGLSNPSRFAAMKDILTT